MKKLLLILVFVFIASPVYAAKVTSDDVAQLITRMQTIMNRRDAESFQTFFGYYADSEARFLKTSYLVDANDPKTILAQESLNMDRKQYIAYLDTILNPPSKYVYQATINSIAMDDSKSQALISYSTQEYATNSLFDDSHHRIGEEVSLIHANCNMIASYSGSDVVILSINCSEKISKKRS
ncbi:MAG: hypothetical protein ACHP6I_00980 [Rickettsiales bacterium]